MLERITERAKGLGGNLSTSQRIALGAGAVTSLALAGGLVANRDRLLNAVMRSDLLVGSTAPGYKKVEWAFTDVDPDTITTWLEFDGDSKASRLPAPRLYKSAGVLAMHDEELGELQQQNKAAVPAVAWMFGDRVVVGELPGSFGYIGEGDSQRAVAMRIGHGSLLASAGLWSAETGAFDVPPSLAIEVDRVPIHDMQLANMYPKVPIV